MSTSIGFAGEYLFIANALLFLSFLQQNQLMFRLVIISATTFFLVNAIIDSTLFLDVIILHSSFILINTYTAYKLFFRIIPPEIDKESHYVFNCSFNKFLTKSQFYKLNQICKRRVFRVNSPIALTGNGFVSVFLVVVIPEEGEVKLKYKHQVISTLDEFSWIGIVEYVNLINKGNLDNLLSTGNTGLWEVDSLVRFDKKNISMTRNEFSSILQDFKGNTEELEVDDNNILNNNKKPKDIDKNNEINKFKEVDDKYSDEFSNKSTDSDDMTELDEDYIRSKKEVIIYEWTLNDLNNLFMDAEEGGAIKNSLHSLWLVYFAKYLMEKNKNSNVTKSYIKNQSML